MNEFRADLHCHSTCSDGSKTPAQVVNIAKEIGLKGLAITDHDSIEAYPTALPLAESLGIEMISGVEFSTVHKGVSVHILGYSFDLNNTSLHAFCRQHNMRRTNRNKDILELLKAHGMPVTEEEVLACLSDSPSGKHTIGRPHIAQAMIKKGYVGTIQEAFKKYLGEGQKCYAPGKSFSTEETIDLIHEAGGLAVIAHPHLMDSGSTLRQLLEMKFDGIECYYAKFPLNQQTRWIEIAHKKNWIITGGSDYHGDIKPNLPLGASYVGEATFRQLKEHFDKNRSGR